MAGIDNITNEILQEAKERAAVITADARKQAAEQIEAAEKEGEQLRRRASEKAQLEARSYAERISSQAELRKRQAALAAKQEIIGDMIDAACEKLRAQSDAEYFAMLAGLVSTHLRAAEGELLLGSADLARLPGDFPARMNALAQKAGGSLQLAGEAAAIRDGFILRYGGIEENCTLKALFAEKHEALVDRVMEAVW